MTAPTDPRSSSSAPGPPYVPGSTHAAPPGGYVPGSTQAAPPPGAYVPGSTQVAPPPYVPGSTRAAPPGPGTSEALGAPGRRIGPYVVERELGRGGMGVVLVVRHPQVPRPLAMKVILGGAGPEALRRFGQEAQVMARVRHTNVVVVHELGQAPEGPYLVSELVEGTGLDRRLREGPLPPREAAALVRALADGLAACHMAGVVHRDLKPANVMLRADGSPVLLDFGIARDQTAERMTRTGQLMGTPAYMAPEQAEGDKQLDARVDVYGLAAILFECLAGRPPFPQDGPPVAILKKVLLEEPVWPRATRPEVPRELEEVVRVAMSRTREARHASAAALRQDLDRWLEGEPTWASTQVPRPRRRLGLSVAAGLTLVALAAGALVARRAGAPPPREVAAESTARRPAPPAVVRDDLQDLIEDERLRADARRASVLAWWRSHPGSPRRAHAEEFLRRSAVDRPVWVGDLGHPLTRCAWLRFLDDRTLLVVESTGVATRFELGGTFEARLLGSPRLELPSATEHAVAGAELLTEGRLLLAVNRQPTDGGAWSGELLVTGPLLTAPRRVAELDFGVTCLALSQDRGRVCAGGGVTPAYNQGRGVLAVHRLADGVKLFSREVRERVNCATFSPDDAWLLTGIGGMYPVDMQAKVEGRELIAWRLDGQGERRHVEPSLGAVSGVAFVGTAAAVGTTTQFIRVEGLVGLTSTDDPFEDRTLHGGEQLASGGKVTAHRQGVLELLVRGDTLWSTSSSGWGKDDTPPVGELRRWSIRTLEERPLPEALGRGRAPTSIALSPDGRVLALVRAGSRQVEVWDTATLDGP